MTKQGPGCGMITLIVFVGLVILTGLVFAVGYEGGQTESSNPRVQKCVDELEQISRRTGQPLGDARGACGRIIAREEARSEPDTPDTDEGTGTGTAFPNPVEDPEGYAEYFCRISVQSLGLSSMAEEYGVEATPEAVARSYAEGVTEEIRTVTEAGCLTLIIHTGSVRAACASA